MSKSDDDERKVREEREKLRKFQEEADRAAREIARKIQEDEVNKKRNN